MTVRPTTPPQVAREFPITYIRGEGRGAGAARNLGWRAARTPLVWFVDSDCVAEPDALSRLLPHLDDPKVAGVGGSYGIMTGHSLLACLIHEEIVQRHQSMGSRVNFLATFNVVYRRSALEEVGGFDERFLKGQDAELSWRVLEAGHELAFDIGSRVKHYHPVSWPAYLQTQSQQGYWRVWLYLKHRGHAAGDSYSGLTDHLQPPLAMLTLAALPLLLWPATWWLPAIMLLLLLVFQMPMTWKIVRRTRRPAYAGFAIMSVVRAFWRGAGMTAAVLMFLITGRRGGGSGSARSTGQVGRETDASRDQK